MPRPPTAPTPLAHYLSGTTGPAQDAGSRWIRPPRYWGLPSRPLHLSLLRGGPGVCAYAPLAPLSIQSLWKRAGHVPQPLSPRRSRQGGTHTCVLLTGGLYLCSAPHPSRRLRPRQRQRNGGREGKWEGRKAPPETDTQTWGLLFGLGLGVLAELGLEADCSGKNWRRIAGPGYPASEGGEGSAALPPAPGKAPPLRRAGTPSAR